MLSGVMKQLIAAGWWTFNGSVTVYRKNRNGSSATMGKPEYMTFRIAIGSGKSTLADDALWLEEPIDEGYEIVSRSSSFNEKKDSFFNVMMTIRNTSSEKLTINELGLYDNGATGTGLPVGTSCMFAREVLNEPIIVAPGKSCVLSMNLTWST